MRYIKHDNSEFIYSYTDRMLKLVDTAIDRVTWKLFILMSLSIALTAIADNLFCSVGNTITVLIAVWGLRINLSNGNGMVFTPQALFKPSYYFLEKEKFIRLVLEQNIIAFDEVFELYKVRCVWLKYAHWSFAINVVLFVFYECAIAFLN